MNDLMKTLSIEIQVNRLKHHVNLFLMFKLRQVAPTQAQAIIDIAEKATHHDDHGMSLEDAQKFIEAEIDKIT